MWARNRPSSTFPALNQGVHMLTKFHRIQHISTNVSSIPDMTTLYKCPGTIYAAIFSENLKDYLSCQLQKLFYLLKIWNIFGHWKLVSCVYAHLSLNTTKLAFCEKRQKTPHLHNKWGLICGSRHVSSCRGH